VYLGDWEEKKHESVAYAIFHLAVATNDFINQCHARYVSVEQSDIGSAIVTFNSGLEREGILRGNPHSIAPYSLTFVKHDEGPNVRDVLVDRFAWMMFIGFPMNFVHTRHLDKAVAFFG
jgi:hypothetical protein